MTSYSSDFWFGVFCRQALPGDESECRKLAKFAVSNEINSLTCLEAAGNPAEWVGAGEFSREELKRFANMCR